MLCAGVWWGVFPGLADGLLDVRDCWEHQDVWCPKITQGWDTTAANLVDGQFASPSHGKIACHRAQTGS